MLSFVNTKKSSIQLRINYGYGAGQIHIAEKYPDVVVKGKPQKGQRIFDWENGLRFAVYPIEAEEMLDVAKKRKDEARFIHTYNDVASALRISWNGDYLNVMIGKKDGNGKKSISYGFTGYDVRRFIRWLTAVAELDVKIEELNYILYELKKANNTESNGYTEVNFSETSKNSSSDDDIFDVSEVDTFEVEDDSPF